jgi:hypothetical protein
MESKNFILDPDDAQLLQDKNLVVSHGRNRRKLDRSWMFSEESVESAISADSAFSNKVEIPAELNSLETLLYIGFTSSTAEIQTHPRHRVGQIPDQSYH